MPRPPRQSTAGIRTFTFGLLSLAIACAGADGRISTTAPVAPVAQAISFLGDSLTTMPLSAETRARYEAQLAEARTAFEHTPTDLDSIVWYGRRLGYLGQFRESIEIYTRGLALYPDNPWLLRHRGHRYISVRELDRAIEDLDRAATLVRGQPDVVEPDGQPNAQNTPIGTLHSNIFYHLALAHYLKGDYARTVALHEQELRDAHNDDRRVSTGHWLYMSLRRLGEDSAAAAMLAPFTRDMNIVENQSYHRLLLLYKGELPADSVLVINTSGEMTSGEAAIAYGVGNWHVYNGRRDLGLEVFRAIIASGQWASFGYIAAEADLAYMR